VARLRGEIRALVDAGGHLMPYYLQRGFSNPNVWPNTTTKPETPPKISYNGDGNVYWHDPGELLLSMAMAYPYLDAPLQADLRAYMAAEFQRYPPLSNMPWSNQPWLKTGVARELRCRSGRRSTTGRRRREASGDLRSGCGRGQS
jgi:hypothetical protein